MEQILSEVNYKNSKKALTPKQRTHKKLVPFLMQFQPLLPCLKNILMDKWHLIQEQPLLGEIFKETPLISYRKGTSLKDMLVSQWVQPESRWSLNPIIITSRRLQLSV